MQDGIHSNTRSRRACLLALALLASGAVVAGCGGSSTSPTATTVAGATTARADAATTAGSSTATGTHAKSSGSQTAGGSGPLAFARCMRANGVPNFPDPKPGGGFDVTGLDPAAPAFLAAQSKCQKLMDGGAVGGPLIPGATTHPSPQTVAKLVRIAQCMREHGIRNFPDPRTSIPSDLAASGIREVTNFDGVILLFPDTMNLQAPAYKQALTACGAPPLGLPH